MERESAAQSVEAGSSKPSVVLLHFIFLGWDWMEGERGPHGTQIELKIAR